MKDIGLAIIGAFLFFYSCGRNSSNSIDESSEYIVDSTKTDIVLYKMEDSLFTDTLKIFNKGEDFPCVYQIWKSGELISVHAIDKLGKWHEIKFSNEIDSASRHSTFDYIGDDLKYYEPYSEGMYQFFDSHRFIHFKGLSNRDTNIMAIYNVPPEIYFTQPKDTTLFMSRVGDNQIKLFSTKKSGETEVMRLFYFPYETKSKTIELKVGSGALWK